jgi:hypothetical protein
MITATPQLVPLVPASDATIAAVDVASNAPDSATSLRTITLTAPRASWAVEGAGLSFAVAFATPTAATVVTLTSAVSTFTADMVGRSIVIAGASAGNNGSYPIASFISATQITYLNPNGLAEAVGFTWSVGLLKGKFLIDAANNTVSGVIFENTSSYVKITNNSGGMTAPFRIMEPSATLTGSALRKGVLSSINAGSIGLMGLRIESTTPGQQGLYIDTPGTAALTLCEITGMGAPPQYGALLPCRTDLNHACWIKGACNLSSYRGVFFRGAFFDRVQGVDQNRNLLTFVDTKSIFFTRCVFDACRTIAPVNGIFSFVRNVNAAAVEWYFISQTLVRNSPSTGAAVFFSGSVGYVTQFDAYSNTGSAILCSGGPGVLNLDGARTTGNVNAGLGVDVRHGMRVLLSTNGGVGAPGTELRGRDTTFPAASAFGDSFFPAGPGVMGLFAATASFPGRLASGDTDLSGRLLTIAGATSAGNDGTFVILFRVNANVIIYANPLGVPEGAVVGVTTWTLEGGDMQVGTLPIRTWVDWDAAVPPSGHPSRNEYDVTAAAATGASGTGSQVIAEPFVP